MRKGLRYPGTINSKEVCFENAPNVRPLFRKSSNKKQFLLDKEPWMLSFLTNQCLEVLIRSKRIFLHWTFKNSTAAVFANLHTVRDYKRMEVVVLALLGSKSEDVYSYLFETLIIEGYEKFSVTLMPELIVTKYDWEIFQQSKRFSSFLSIKAKDSTSLIFYWMFHDLSFIPLNKVPQAFNSCGNTFRKTNYDYPKLEPIFNYALRYICLKSGFYHHV